MSSMGETSGRLVHIHSVLLSYQKNPEKCPAEKLLNLYIEQAQIFEYNKNKIDFCLPRSLSVLHINTNSRWPHFFPVHFRYVRNVMVTLSDKIQSHFGDLNAQSYVIIKTSNNVAFPSFPVLGSLTTFGE